MNSKSQKRYRLDVWIRRNWDAVLDKIRDYYVAKYNIHVYDSRIAKELRETFIDLLVRENYELRHKGVHVWSDDRKTSTMCELALGECFYLVAPLYEDTYTLEKPYLDFLTEMKWLTRERYLLDEPYIAADYYSEFYPWRDYPENDEEYCYYYGINHAQLEANFNDVLATKREYDVCKLDKLLST